MPGGAGESYDSEQNYGYGGGATVPAHQRRALLDASRTAPPTPNGNTSYFTTDRLGNVVSYTDPYGNVTTYTRDANGLVTQLTQPPPAAGDAAPVTTFTYDSAGQ